MIVCCDYDAASDLDYERVARVLAGYGIAFHRSVNGALPLVENTGGTSFERIVRDALKANPRVPVFYFGHGRSRPPALLGRGEAVVLDRKGWTLLRDRLLCVTACYSAEDFGEELRAHGVSLLGYRGLLNVFFEEPWISRMESAVLAGPSVLMNGDSLAAAKRAAAAAYDQLATELYDSPNPNDYVVGPFIEQNARAVEMTGDGARTV